MKSNTKAASIGILLVILSSAPPALAFDVDGFRSGMTYEEAKQVVSRLAPAHSPFFDPTSIVWGAGQNLNTSIRSLTFKQDGPEGVRRLAIYQKNLPFDFSRFVALVKSFRDRLGTPTEVLAAPADPSQEYSQDFVTIAWRAEKEQIAVKYRPDYLIVVYTDFSIWPDLKRYAP